MMKTTRRGLFGIFGGAAAIVATKQLLPEPVVDTIKWAPEIPAGDIVYYGGGKSNLSDIITVNLKNNVRQLSDNISRNNPLFERLTAEGRIHKLKKT